MDHILNTKLALQRKYYIGEVLDYCEEYLTNLNDIMKILTPVAVRASLLMTLLIKIKSVIKNYDFNVSFIENILIDINNMVQIDTKVSSFDSTLKRAIFNFFPLCNYVTSVTSCKYFCIDVFLYVVV